VQTGHEAPWAVAVDSVNPESKLRFFLPLELLECPKNMNTYMNPKNKQVWISIVETDHE
jgi:hypothetical protein